MPVPEFAPVTAAAPAAEIGALSALATAIVREHYDPIIGREQNDYMLEKFQSPAALREQMAAGYRYYRVERDGRAAGFLAFLPREGKMYLSKLYLARDCRGEGLGRAMVDFVTGQARREKLAAVFLNVNRHNAAAIAFYRHLGFHLLREEKNPIGNGFFMDDLVLELPL
ncbi:MAG: GNAT family N-acetyltransferase [Planctomycetes bacterium]|nr:GNAT family N-acetyltransferase [Planctomycetota bacterium]